MVVKIDLKTVAPRNVIDLTGFRYRDEINKACMTLMLRLLTRTLCLWTETPFCAGLVLSMGTLSAKGI